MRADSLIGYTAPDVSIGGGSPFHRSNVPVEEFLGIHIKLPKIAIGRAIGNVIKDTVPGGSTIVGVANAAIDVVKKEKLTPGKILANVPAATVDAAKAQIQNNLTPTTENVKTAALGSALTSNGLVIPILLVAVVFFAMKGSK